MTDKTLKEFESLVNSGAIELEYDTENEIFMMFNSTGTCNIFTVIHGNGITKDFYSLKRAFSFYMACTL